MRRRRQPVVPTSTKLRNLESCARTYGLRRRAIKHVYEARDLLRRHGIEMPRVQIRVSESAHPDYDNSLACAKLGARAVWFMDKYLATLTPRQLRWVVFHELVHAITGFRHDENCSLMSPRIPNQIPSDHVIDEIFVQYFQTER